MPSLLRLPHCLLISTLTFLSFQEICQHRAVSPAFQWLSNLALPRIETVTLSDENEVLVDLLCAYGRNLRAISFDYCLVEVN